MTHSHHTEGESEPFISIESVFYDIAVGQLTVKEGKDEIAKHLSSHLKAIIEYGDKLKSKMKESHICRFNDG